MQAKIKIVTADKDFDEDQKKILRRVMMVLAEHNLSVAIEMKVKVKKTKQLKIKTA